MILAETFIQLIRDPAHWGLELVTEICFFTVEFFFIEAMIHRHREKKYHQKRHRGKHET